MHILKKTVITIITWEAKMILRKYKPYVIAVTGNVGKTSAKDAIYTALQKSRYVRKSQKSLNSDIGVPLTIIGRESGWSNPFIWFGIILEGLLLILLKNHYPKVLVLEVGADHPGDIANIASWLRPDIGVVTGIPDVPVHITYFGSPEKLAEEKKQLLKHVRPGGSIILNGDDDRARAMYDDFKTSAILYGFGAGNSVVASHEEVMYKDGEPQGMRFRVNHRGSSVPLVVQGALGNTHIYPMLAACAVADVMGIDLVSAGSALSEHVSPPGRMRIVKGRNKTTIIDDSYNASPAATLSALTTLGSLQVTGKKWALLGDMRELGEFSEEAHARVGLKASEVCDYLVTVGEESLVLKDAAKNAGMKSEHIQSFGYGESEKAGEYALAHVKEGDVVLIKGSQNKIRMEKAVKVLMAHPQDAYMLLVRQGNEWVKKA